MKRSGSNGSGGTVSRFKLILIQLSLLLNKKRRKQLIIIFKKITQIYGINLIFYVNKWKLKKLQGTGVQIRDFMPWLKESTILVLLNILYPALKKLSFLKSDYLYWTSIVGISLVLTKGEVPSWLFAHLLVEILHSKLKCARLVQRLKKNLPQGTLTEKLKEFFLCSMVVVLFTKLDRNSLSFHALFDRRPFLTDFVTINGIFALSALYRRIVKLFFTSETNESKESPNHQMKNFSQLLGVKNHNDWPISSSNLKHVMDRLNEIHEIAIGDNYADLSEKLLNSFIARNIIPSLRWTIIRQCVRYLFAANMSNKLRCTVMLITFTMVDPTSKIKINAFFVKLFAKSLANIYLKKYWRYNFQKYVLFFLFQFSIT